jgi:hypothetical protein
VITTLTLVSITEVFADLCRTARGDHTSEWVVYRPSGGSGPSPTPQPDERPTPNSSGSCIYDLNLRDGSFIQDGQRKRSPDDSDLYLELRDNGLLAIRDGGRTIWDSGEQRSDGDYWTQLQVSEPTIVDPHPRIVQELTRVHRTE